MSDIHEEQNTNITSPIELDPEQDAQLVSHGYEPICVDAQTKKPASTGWSKGEITVERISIERAEFPKSSTGLRTGKLVGVDVDVVNKEHWSKLIELAVKVLGDTPLTRRGSKGLLAAYSNPMPIGKISIKGKFDKKSVTLVEILGQGQQFVAFGIHPKTNKPYEWTGSDSDPDLPSVFSPLVVALADLPKVSPDNLREFASKAAALLTELGYQDVTISGDTGEERSVSDRAGKPVSEETLRSALSAVYANGDNKGEPVFEAGCSREEWRNTIAAIAAAIIVGDDDQKAIAKRIACEYSRGE